MKTVVISQPMYFPWVGMHEQMKLADHYVNYADVAFSKGSFTNRVQVKIPTGWTWLTVPLKEMRLGQTIDEIEIDDRKNWQRKHRATLAQAYSKAPFVKEMLDLVDSVYGEGDALISELSLRSMKTVHSYFGFENSFEFHDSREMQIPGEGSQRVIDIVRQLQGNRYVTGHGAKNYLQHDLFEAEGIDVAYMDYQKREYPQLHGEFNPFVSALDLIANCGKEGSKAICPKTISWKEFTL